MLNSVESRETREYASEVKFLVTPEQGAEIERWATRWLRPDPHGAEYQVTSLYFDTPDSRVFRRQGSYARAKYRIRRYGDSGCLFLERKLRSKQVVVKRRTTMPLAGLDNLSQRTEARWFERRLEARGLRPVWQISYQRTARELTTNQGPIRLTLDRQLAAVAIDSIAFRDTPPIPLFDNQEMILELKFRQAMPELFGDLIAEFGLEPQPVSKFRLAAAVLQSQQEESRCA